MRKNRFQKNENGRIPKDIKISKETRKTAKELAIKNSKELSLKDNVVIEQTSGISKKIQNMEQRKDAQLKEKERYNKTLRKSSQWRMTIKIEPVIDASKDSSLNKQEDKQKDKEEQER